MIKLIKVSIVTSMLLFMSACSILSPIKVSDISTYSLVSLHPTISRHRQTNLTLLITRPIANAGYDSAHMIYVNVPYKLKSYVNNQWVAPPAQMLQSMISEAMVDAGYFHAVVTPPYAGLADYRLDVRLLTLQQEFLRPTSQVHLLIEAHLISNKTNRIIASKRFQSIKNAAGNNPYSGVLAANQAAASVCTQLVRFTRLAIQSTQ